MLTVRLRAGYERSLKSERHIHHAFADAWLIWRKLRGG